MKLTRAANDNRYVLDPESTYQIQGILIIPGRPPQITHVEVWLEDVMRWGPHLRPEWIKTIAEGQRRREAIRQRRRDAMLEQKRAA